MRPQALVAVLAVLSAGIGGGVLLDRHVLSASSQPPAGRTILYWWDPMMPDFKSPTPGKSPMGMDMVPVYAGEEPAADPGTVTVTAGMVQMLGVRSVPVESGALAPVLETFGSIAFDESRTAHVHVRAPGWIERLNRRSVGETVARGEVLFEFFSPNLASAAFEYVRELERPGGPGLEGARRKLAALGVDDRQVEEIRSRRTVPDRVKVYAPQSGAIVALDAAEGMYVEPGMTLLSLTDTASVWVTAEVTEGQAAFVRPGLTAQVEVKGLPDRRWSATVEYVYPDLRPETRTLRLRLRLDNPDGVLRPGMFASVHLAASARPAVPTVPADAVIRTGRDDRVVLDLGQGRFRPVPVRTGLTVGDRTEVTEGLRVGDRVVTAAQFLLDSEANLSGGLARLAAAAPEPAPAGPIWTRAVVVAPLADGMVTLRHDPIPAIGWPAMTMGFAVDPAVTARMPEGSTLRVALEKTPEGAYRIVAVEPAGDRP
ncbi:efflux RND transporter periplasmic adaptor subunit [Oleisolibacter albus]|uniref:efflux RND transporter periplasmic adaptor subunit n=1 Tax=Oleisolibacter albus TaxID=2171757 RepID=UPI00138FE86A|nr:efflux RND transporter periplasmic adaptor subunit [Oleisolibacter albus]